MITQPSCQRLVDVVRAELAGTIAPAIEDPGLRAMLGMIDSILAGVSARCGHEVAWMREEIRLIEEAAEATVAVGADVDGRVAAAGAELRAGRATTDEVADVEREYDLAGEVLSRCLEAALPAGPEPASIVRAVLEQRLHRELQIRGEFSLVGRG